MASFKASFKEAEKKLSFLPKSKAFTLIELLIVVAIIGILSSVVLVGLRGVRAKARDAQRISDFRQIQAALELFYSQTNRYPRSPGAPTWAGHWANFATCLETGSGCGFTISNYHPVMRRVPQDPQHNPATSWPTYYPGYPTGCTDGQSYRLAVRLETDNQVLDTDLDGSFYNNNNGCEDLPNRGYCVGVGTCTGW